MTAIFAILTLAVVVAVLLPAAGLRRTGFALVAVIALAIGARAGTFWNGPAAFPLPAALLAAQETEQPAEETAIAKDGAPAADAEGAADKADKADALVEPGTGDSVPEERTSEAGVAQENGAAEAAMPEPNLAGDNRTDDRADDQPGDAGVEPARRVVEKVTNVRYPDRGADAPAWLGGQPWTEADTYFVPVLSKVQSTRQECAEALASRIEEAVDRYVNELLKSPRATRLVRDRLGDLRDRLVIEEFAEHVEVTDGRMQQTHALLAFDDDFREDLFAQWDQVKAARKLMQTGLGAGVVLLLLTTLFGYFRLDTATRGYYTGRLQFAAAAAILAVITATVLFAQWIPRI